MADAPDLDPHLAERLAETRDAMSFSRRPPMEGVEAVERTVNMPEHLGGRAIADAFRRTRAEPPRPRGLEPHLKDRLLEVVDEVTLGTGDPLAAYRARRRALGGGPS